MSPEKQRRTILEACGWTAKEDKDGFWRAVDPSGNMTYTLWVSKMNVWSAGMPDVLEDLNAMHEAEKVLTDEQDLEYSEALEQVVKGRFATANSEDMRRLRSATASQRAEAFLRTIGKWEEGK
jgi:hypothetical protein